MIQADSASFVKFYNLLDNRVVTEFSYRMSQAHTGHIICSFLLRSAPSSASGPSPTERAKEIGDILKSLKEHDMSSTDLSENEFAKSHVRHLVGGRGAVDNERLFRFGKHKSPFVYLTRNRSSCHQNFRNASVHWPTSLGV
jgi:threonine dehydratase